MRYQARLVQRTMHQVCKDEVAKFFMQGLDVLIDCFPYAMRNFEPAYSFMIDGDSRDDVYYVTDVLK